MAEQPALEDLGLRYDDTIVTESARTVDFNGQAFVPRYVETVLRRGGRHLTVREVSGSIVFAPHEDATVALTIPFVSKRFRGSNPMTGERDTLESEGLGDVALVGKYRFFQETGAGETTEAAVLAGVELPTGRDDVRDGGVRLPQPLQPGSGSLDAILGGAFTRVDGRWLVNADLIGKFNSEGNDYRFGNEYHFDVGGQFRVHPARYERFDQTTVNVVGELNGVYAQRDSFQGDTLSDTGGLKLFATPGLQVIFGENLLAEAAVQLPVFRNLPDSQLREAYRVISGIRIRF